MSFSTNSLTSRPRSPIRAITLISAFVFLANIPIKVDLPTPEPAKIPILCPFPTVIRPSTALTPSERGSEIITLSIGSGGAASTGYSESQISSSPSAKSVGRPRPSTVWPKSSSPTCIESGFPVFSTIQPTPTPSIFSKGISKSLLSLKPTTSAIILRSESAV